MSDTSELEKYVMQKSLEARGFAQLLAEELGIDAEFGGMATNGKELVCDVALENVSADDAEKIKSIITSMGFVPKGTKEVDDETVADVFERNDGSKIVTFNTGGEITDILLVFPLNR